MEAPIFFLSLAGILFAGFVFSKITGLIKTWINRNNNSLDDEKFDRLAKAFIKYKKDSERRFQNLEAILTDDTATSRSQRDTSHEQIHIDAKDSSQTHAKSGERKLPNILDKQRG